MGIRLKLMPTQTFVDRLPSLLVADTTWHYDGAAEFHRRAVIAPFTPRIDLAVGELTLDSTGVTLPDSSTATSYKEPGSNAQHVNLTAALNNFDKASAVGGSFPVTVYGFVLVNIDLNSMPIVEQLQPPVTFTATGQSIIAPEFGIVFDVNSFNT